MTTSPERQTAMSNETVAAVQDEQLFDSGDPYAPIICPMPECAGELWITHTTNKPVGRRDFAADLANPLNCYTQRWEIGCTEGHVLLLPESHGDDTEAFGQECYLCADDESAANVPVRHGDLARLRALILSGSAL